MQFATRCKSSLVLAGATCAFIASSPVDAYDEAGQFYTAAVVHQSRNPAYKDIPFKQAQVIGFCVQLPDLVKELDAVTLRLELAKSVDGALWGAFSVCLLR